MYIYIDTYMYAFHFNYIFSNYLSIHLCIYIYIYITVDIYIHQCNRLQRSSTSNFNRLQRLDTRHSIHKGPCEKKGILLVDPRKSESFARTEPTRPSITINIQLIVYAAPPPTMSAFPPAERHSADRIPNLEP